MPTGNGTEDIGLAETIRLIRGELRKAQDDGSHSDVRFSVGSVEVELAIEVVKTAGGEASINVLNLVTIGGRGERSKSDTNRVTVVLDPIGRDGEPFEVAAARLGRPDGLPPAGRDGRPGG